MGLPSGYTQYEYIESSGAQYIDTGFIPNQDSRVELDFQLISETAEQTPFLARQGAQSRSFGIFHPTSGWNADYGATRTLITNDIAITERIYVDFNKNSISLNDVTKTVSPQTFTSPVSLCLFVRNTNRTLANYCVGKIYTCKVHDNGTLIRDYIPCSDPSGEVGLYDQVNGVFYGNAGTGTFSHGPVVITTPPAPQNLRQTGKTLESISLAWDVVDAANGYKLYRDGTLIATQAATSYTDTGLLPSESHSYQVLAYNDQGDGTLSESVSMSTEQAYYVVTPVFTSAAFSPNPATINTPVLLSVAVEDQMIILQPEVFQSSEIYSGEAS